MRLQVLGSGSRGNATLVRAGEGTALVDAGLPLTDLALRLELARIAPRAIEHVLVTHGHLDHARSAGAIARRQGATVHCAERIMGNASVRRAPRLSTVGVGRTSELPSRHGGEPLRCTAVALPHDCDPTVAYKLEHGGRCAVILTDMGAPRRAVADALRGAHVLVLEFNHDRERMLHGPYPFALKRRIGSDHGHLSNEQSAQMLTWLVGPELHTLVLAHLSETNNTPELALDAARAVLARLCIEHVKLVVARQDEALEAIDV
jgi:phosphoribosyl 1,2-cyclic phosphodiesterase